MTAGTAPRGEAAGLPFRPVRDAAVRAAVARRVRRQHAGRRHLLVGEVDVAAGGRRMDLLLVGSGLTAFEIKSDVDGLGRLRPQALAYGLVADRAVLVVGLRHRMTAAKMVPGWWAVWEATAGPRAGVTLQVVRRGAPNPDVDPLALAGLLLRSELVEEFALDGVRTGLSRLTAAELRSAFADHAGAELGARVRRQLLWRRAWQVRAASLHVPAAV